MNVTVRFYSYFKDMAKGDALSVSLTEGATIGELLEKLFEQVPQLRAMQKSMLVAVGVEYQDRKYVLKIGDEVSLFPPVQGG